MVKKFLLTTCCLSSCSYIKPQPFWYFCKRFRVVYHLVPTSNHNWPVQISFVHSLFIILFLHQTTTVGKSVMNDQTLFIILFLHQTTTQADANATNLQLFIILFLHQTTTLLAWIPRCSSCLSSCSYIKPQLLAWFSKIVGCCLSSCSYIKPQLRFEISKRLVSCLSSCSYIKPQRALGLHLLDEVVYHLVPTSNHNL